MSVPYDNTGWTGWKMRISGSLPAYRRNAGVDPAKQGLAFRRTVSNGQVAIDDAETQGRTAGFPRSFALASGKFIWSVMMRMFRRFQPVSVILFLIVVAFLAGFLAFGEKVTRMQPPVLGEPADAIVVLTGGQSRIQAAVDLLKEKQGRRLLISGVHPSTNGKSLQRATHSDPGLFDCCVDLDRSALNTVGNATESERWIRANNYHRVIVVTNNYHIPRSILEMSSRMKDVEFIPYPVVNEERREQSWVSEGDTLRVLFIEYVKYLGAAIRIGGAAVFSNTPAQEPAAQR